MTTFKKCDRCGKKMDSYNAGLHFYRTNPFRVIQKYEVFADREIDLCEDCREDFKKFLYKKKEN